MFKKWSNKLYIGLFIIILLVSTYLKVFPVLDYNFPFTMDQARDMLDIRKIAVDFKPVLIGPTTSINGVFLGPAYYYFNTIPFLISQGDPAALVYWNILWYLIPGILLFIFFYKKDRVFALVSSIIYLMSPGLFYSSRYFWNANCMPFMAMFFFLSLYYFIQKRDVKSSFLVGLIAGLGMQFQAAFGILFIPFLIIYSLIKKVSVKKLIPALLTFFATLLPQILFELKNNFIMTKTFLGEASGESAILGEKLSFIDAQISHIKSFFEFTQAVFEIPNIFSYAFIILAIVYLVINFKKLHKVTKEFFLISAFFLIFAFAFYSLYSYPLKGWFILSLRIPYIFIAAVFLSELLRSNKVYLKALPVIFLVFSFIMTFYTQSKYIPENINVRSGDKSNLRNEIEAIDWVYNKAQNQGFKSYNYIPSVYDFPYQYLYWWYGTKKYGYQPETLTYLDNVPEYVRDQQKYLTSKKSAGEDPLIMMIYEIDENPERLKAWLGSFTQYCSLEKQDYSWGTTVEVRKKCN